MTVNKSRLASCIRSTQRYTMHLKQRSFNEEYTRTIDDMLSRFRCLRLKGSASALDMYLYNIKGFSFFFIMAANFICNLSFDVPTPTDADVPTLNFRMMQCA